MNESSKETKGVKRQILGAVLLSLGLLNCMLSLKAGVQLDSYNLALLSTGAVLLLSGLMAKRCSRYRDKEGRPV